MTNQNISQNITKEEKEEFKRFYNYVSSYKGDKEDVAADAKATMERYAERHGIEL